MNISKGEHVLHPQHGVGKIKSIRERSFYGHAPARYVQLYFKLDELTMTLLEDDVFNNVRGLISAEEAQESPGSGRRATSEELRPKRSGLT